MKLYRSRPIKYAMNQPITKDEAAKLGCEGDPLPVEAFAGKLCRLQLDLDLFYEPGNPVMRTLIGALSDLVAVVDMVTGEDRDHPAIKATLRRIEQGMPVMEALSEPRLQEREGPKDNHLYHSELLNARRIDSPEKDGTQSYIVLVKQSHLSQDTPYVTGLAFDRERGWSNGHYFADLDEATQDFHHRCQRGF